MQNVIKVLIIDDSTVIRQLLCSALEPFDDIEVVGEAENAEQARSLINQLNPDVLTLDIEMPGMDGLSFLEKVMRLHPMPVIMISSLTERNSDIAMQALSLGAVGYIPKPKHNIIETVNSTEFIEELHAIIRAASHAQVDALDYEHFQPKKAVPSEQDPSQVPLIAIGASTGGVEAVRRILTSLSPPSPPIVVAIHIPAHFSTSMALRLDKECELTVIEACGKMTLKPNHVFIAPGGFHLTLEKIDRKIKTVLDNKTGRINQHRPCIDMLFKSVAQIAPKAIGVLLTGMGSDGAQGLLEMHARGAYTIAQNEQTSLVWGMPRSAIELNAVEDILPLHRIADALIKKF